MNLDKLPEIFRSLVGTYPDGARQLRRGAPRRRAPNPLHSKSKADFEISFEEISFGTFGKIFRFSASTNSPATGVSRKMENFGTPIQQEIILTRKYPGHVTAFMM